MRTETEQLPIGETVPAETKWQGPGSPSILKQTKISKNKGKMCLGHWMRDSYRAGVLERGNRRVRARVAPPTCLERAFRPWECWGPRWSPATGVEGGHEPRSVHGKARKEGDQVLSGDCCGTWGNHAATREEPSSALTARGTASASPARAATSTPWSAGTWVEHPERSRLNGRAELALN